MASSKMFVPDKIKVGYQNRPGTYTGKLAYVIYYDEKGKVRKEKSWESWRDKKIAAQDFENVPTEGFVLNKKAGGTRWSWNTRNTYVRVWDPRDFEFEISIPNLLFILQECTATKGKGLEGEFVYAWDGTEIVLLPVESEEYKSCKEHTDRQSKKIEAKDVKEGFTYKLKDGTNVLYLGRHPYNEPQGSWTGMAFKPLGKRHIFMRMETEGKERYYMPESGFTRLAEEVSSAAAPEYGDERDKFLASKYYGEMSGVETHKCGAPSKLSYYHSRPAIIKEDDVFKVVEVWCPYEHNYYYDRGSKYTHYHIQKSAPFKVELKNGTMKLPSASGDKIALTKEQFNELQFYSLHVVTAKGTKVKVM